MQDAEKTLLQALGWQLGWATPLAFLKTTVSIEDADKNVIYHAQYFMEVMAVDERLLAFRSSLVGAAAYLLHGTQHSH